MKKTIIRTGLETIYFSGMHHMLRPFLGGVGSILTLHHVRPPRKDGFQPNRLLEVTPIFFEGLLRRLKRRRVDVITSTRCTAALSKTTSSAALSASPSTTATRTRCAGRRLCSSNTRCLGRFISRPVSPTASANCGGWRLNMSIARNERIGMTINGEQQYFDAR